MNPSISIQAIGIVHSSRKEVLDDNWDSETAYIELDQIYGSEALMGLESFSHLEVLFYMDKVETSKIQFAARHPRNNTAWPKVGIFSQRAKNRPNQIGATICKILKVEGNRVYLEGLDAVDATLVIDLKPWVQEFAPRGKIFQPVWISELMKNYWKL